MVGITQALRSLSRPSEPGTWQRSRKASSALAIITIPLVILSLFLGFYDLAVASALLGAMSFGLSLIARAETRAAFRLVFE